MAAPARAIPDRRLVRAAIWLVCGAAIISFAPVFVLTSGVGPTAAAFWRMIFGSIVLLALSLGSPSIGRPSRRAIVLALLAAVCFCGDLMSWHRSIHWVGAGLSTILVNLQVFVLAGYGVWVLRERVSWRLALAIPLALAGLFLLVGLSWSELGHTHQTGVVLGLVAAACYGGYLLLLRAAQRDPASSASAIVAIVSLGCAAILGVAAPLQGESLALPDTRGTLLLIAYGLGPQVLGWVLITRGLAVVKASRAGLILLLQPALAFVWDMALFGHHTTRAELIGAVLALAAIYLGSAPEARRRPAKRTRAAAPGG